MDYVILAIGAVLVVLGPVLVWVLWRKAHQAGSELLDRAQAESRRIVGQAEIESQRILRDADVASRERLLAARTEFERETREFRIDLAGLEKRLTERDDELVALREELGTRGEEIARQEADIAERIERLREEEERLAQAAAEHRQRLEQIAGLTAEQAKAELMLKLEHEAKMEAANLVKRIEDEAIEKAKDKARRVISMAIQRIASEHVVESTVVGGRPAVGRDEGSHHRPRGPQHPRLRAGHRGRPDRRRHPRGGDPVVLRAGPARDRPAWRSTNLIQDGRIHPGRIEEVVAKVQAEMEDKLLADGEAAALEVEHPRSQPGAAQDCSAGSSSGRPTVRTRSSTRSRSRGWPTTWRPSSGSTPRWPSGPGCCTTSARRSTARWKGRTSSIGREMLRRCGETDAVIHAMECHHGDYDPHSVEAVLVTAADALSAARPGARREILENYIKRLEKLETLANDFKGVEKAFAIQAGRELRIVVESASISDEAAIWLARDVARKVESELTYPGQIKVTVIRETRAVEYAK